MPELTPRADAAVLRDWLMSPRADTGVHLANDDGGWDLLPYPILADHARRIAHLLISHGVDTGSTVGVLMPTSHLCLATIFGVLAAGGTLTPIPPPQFETPEGYAERVGGILAASQASTVVTCPTFAGMVDRALLSVTEPLKSVLLEQVPDVTPLESLAEPSPVALLQMTSGSTSSPRGVQISWRNLVTNLRAIDSICGTQPGDRGVSWLPLYHDMGLIGGVFRSIPGQYEMRLLRPDQFIRDPLRWLQAAAGSEQTGSPSFGLDYVSRRLRPQDLGDIDLSGLRTMVVGADRINPAHLRAFTELTESHGFSPSAFVPSYGLAEATLIVSGRRPGSAIRLSRIDGTALHVGQPVRVLSRSRDVLCAEPSPDWLVSVGEPIAGCDLRIVDEAGEAVPEGALGELVLSGPLVAEGYRGEPGYATRFERGTLYTGDAGFLAEGQLYVLGRMGTSLKVNGRSVFTEDLDAAVAEAMGLRASRVVTVAINDAQVPGVAVFVEGLHLPAHEAGIAECLRTIRGHLEDDNPLWLIGVPRGVLLRTSSGKPRRWELWRQWRSGRLAGSELMDYRDPRHTVCELAKVRAFFENARASALISDDATVHFEGSLAEGFGNDGSDIDFLLLIPGAATHAVMPTVLFIDGRRVEMRSQSHEQLRTRLLRVRHAIDSGSLKSITEDLLNRVQRFLHGLPLHIGPHYGELTGIVSYPECMELTARWWLRRAGHCLRHSAGLLLLGRDDEATSWAREGLVQAMKAFLARHGEGYLEVKWLPAQMDRLRIRADRGVVELLDDYDAFERQRTAARGSRELVEQLLDLAARLGAPTVTIDPANIILKRAAGVTTWSIGSTTHVVRNRSEVFVLSTECAESWRRVVFGQTLNARQATQRCIAIFTRYGLLDLEWRGAGVVRPAAAMCDPVRPLTPLPSARRPVITIHGAPADGDIARSPLGAKAFAECAGALMLANMVLENAREDFTGALKDEQWGVATLCGRRMVIMAVRILASGWGVTPLPGDPVLLDGLTQLVPEHQDLAVAARRLMGLSIRDREDAQRAQADLERFVTQVRRATGGEEFPSSFTSPEQWQQTLRLGYQWLRMGAYLDAHVELDETRDLLASGGAQPGGRASSARKAEASG